MMDNLTKITLEPRRKELIEAREILCKSRDALSDQRSEYCEHHRNVIGAYSEMIEILGWRIDRAETPPLGPL